MLTNVTPVNFIEKEKRKGTEMYAGVRGGWFNCLTHQLQDDIRDTAFPISSSCLSEHTGFPVGSLPARPRGGGSQHRMQGPGSPSCGRGRQLLPRVSGARRGPTAGPGPATNDEQFSKRVDDRNEEILTKQNTGIKTWKI